MSDLEAVFYIYDNPYGKIAQFGMRIAQMGHTDIKTTKQFYEFDRETNAEKAQKLGEIEELRLLFEDIFFVPPTVLENLPFRGAVPCGTRKFSPPD